MKKIIVLAFAILVMMTSSSLAANADTTEKKAEMLYNLGIVESQSVTTQKTISLNEFLCSASNMVSKQKVTLDQAYSFMHERGTVSYISNVELKNDISYDRALNVALNTLGYLPLIEHRGNNREAVIRTATEAGLLEGCKVSDFSEALSGEQMIDLLYNMTRADIYIREYNGASESYKIEEDVTILAYYRDIVEIEGRVTKTYNTSLTSEDGCLEDRIVIDNYDYAAQYEYVPELLGMPVKAYVQDIEDDGIVLYVTEKANKVDTVEIGYKDICAINDSISQIEYETGNGRTDILKLNPALKVIYNGKFYKDYTKADLMPKLGSILLVDIDLDNTYDIVHVNSYQTMIVDNVSVTYKKITGKYTYTEALKEIMFDNDNDRVSIYKDGSLIKYNDVAVNDILDVAMSKNTGDKIITIYVSSNTKNATMTAISGDDNKVSDSETEYTVSYLYYEAIKNQEKRAVEIQIGQEQTYYFDSFGNIAYVKGLKFGGYDYAFLLKMFLDDAGEQYIMKVMNIDGEWESLYLNDKIRVNDSRTDKASKVYSDLGGSSVVPQLIMIKKNAEGLINGILISEETAEYMPDKFSNKPQQKRTYWTNDQSFDCRTYINTDTLVFVVPNDDSLIYDEEEYSVEKVSYFRDWREYTYKSYNEDEFNFADAMVVEQNTSASNTYFFVNRSMVGINQNDEVVKRLKGVIGQLIDFEIDEYKQGVMGDYNPGDIITVKFKRGMVSEATLVYSISEGREKEFSGNFYNKTNIFGDILKVDRERSLIYIDSGNQSFPIKQGTDTQIKIFDADTNMFESGNFYDIEEGHYVRVYGDANKFNQIVVYKKDVFRN